MQATTNNNGNNTDNNVPLQNAYNRKQDRQGFSANPSPRNPLDLRTHNLRCALHLVAQAVQQMLQIIWNVWGPLKPIFRGDGRVVRLQPIVTAHSQPAPGSSYPTGTMCPSKLVCDTPTQSDVRTTRLVKPGFFTARKLEHCSSALVILQGRDFSSFSKKSSELTRYAAQKDTNHPRSK